MSLVLPEDVAPDYIVVGAVVLLWRYHPIALEFSPAAFANSFIYGTFGGEIAFYGSMVNRKFLLEQPEGACVLIKKPESFCQADWYSTKHCLRYY